MTEKRCKICGKSFQARQSNYLCCSAECKRINFKQSQARYSEKRKQIYRERYGKGTEKYKQRYAEYFSKHRVIKYCRICNSQLPNSNQKVCFNCLLDMWLKGDKTKAYNILACRGYDKAGILAEIEARDMKNESQNELQHLP